MESINQWTFAVTSAKSDLNGSMSGIPHEQEGLMHSANCWLNLPGPQ
jgi:hypothetical protein